MLASVPFGMCVYVGRWGDGLLSNHHAKTTIVEQYLGSSITLIHNNQTNALNER